MTCLRYHLENKFKIVIVVEILGIKIRYLYKKNKMLISLLNDKSLEIDTYN